jgi:hypothetical protein
MVLLVTMQQLTPHPSGSLKVIYQAAWGRVDILALQFRRVFIFDQGEQ